jgi:hypothetical protein
MGVITSSENGFFTIYSEIRRSLRDGTLRILRLHEDVRGTILLKRHNLEKGSAKNSSFSDVDHNVACTSPMTIRESTCVQYLYPARIPVIIPPESPQKTVYGQSCLVSISRDWSHISI